MEGWNWMAWHGMAWKEARARTWESRNERRLLHQNFQKHVRFVRSFGGSAGGMHVRVSHVAMRPDEERLCEMTDVHYHVRWHLMAWDGTDERFFSSLILLAFLSRFLYAIDLLLILDRKSVV